MASSLLSENCNETAGSNSAHENDYVAQYFGFTPQTLMNGMYNAILGYMMSAMTAVNEAVLQMYRDETISTRLRENASQLWQRAVHKLDEKFDKAEVYLTANVFSMPGQVVLPEDQVQLTSPCSQAEMKQLDTKIQVMLDRIIAVNLANRKLSNRLHQITALQTQLDSDVTCIDRLYTQAKSQSPTFIQSANLIKKTAALGDNIRATLDEP